MPVDFTTFSDNAIVLPDPSNGDIDTDIQFNTPGVDGTKAGVLSFRVNPAGTLPTLRVEINGTTVLTQTYGNNVERTVQENFNQSILNANNELTLQVTGNGSASMSDFLVLYKTV